MLIAHRDRARADEARRRVTIDIEPLPAVLTIDEALAGREIIWGDRQLFKRYRVSKGDVDAALAAAAIVSSRVNTRPARRNSSTSSRTACSRSPIRRTA